MFKDYCRQCHVECGCDRLDVLTEPDDTVVTVGDGWVQELSFYQCAEGHRWRTRFTTPSDCTPNKESENKR